MAIYARPATLPDALQALRDAASSHGSADRRLTILAGGTDYYPARAARAAWSEPASRDVIDISRIEELKGVRDDGAEIAIGALTTWAQLCANPLPSAFDGLKAAAREVGGAQVQNRGTVAGNLCNASPAADGVPPLLALDAVVELASLNGWRRLPLRDFILGNRKTALAPDELLVAVRVPKPSPHARSAFRKLGARTYLVISIVSVAAVIAHGGDNRITRAAVAVGACSAVPQRLSTLERGLVGLPMTSEAIEVVSPTHLEALSPIDDVRGSASYRRHGALVLVRRALADCLTNARGAAA
jgi:CO/xanthine dehydrogenase FAD-binding subunit